MSDKNKEKDPIDSYIEKAKRAESNGNTNAKNPNSSAKGLYQFTDSTWKNMEKQLGRKLSMDNVADQDAAMKAFTKENASALQKAGLPVNDNNLYIVHHFGAKGGIDFLKKLDKDPNGLASNFISKEAVNANKSLFYNDQNKPVTASELYNKLSSKVGDNKTEIPLQEKVNQLVQNQPAPAQESQEETQDQSLEEQIPIDNTTNQKKEFDRIKNLTGILSSEEIQNDSQPQNNVENTRQDLNLSSGTLDFLPKDSNLIFNEETNETTPDNETNEAKLGGKQNYSTDTLNEFNVGGSHEENSFGGIPQGIGSNGKMNTVQEGETKYKDYIFTNDLKVNAQDAKDLFLPEDIVGMTFAEASKYINKIAEENPFDKIIKKTVEKQNDSLILGNEKARLAKEQLDLNQGKIQNKDQFFLGGLASTEMTTPTADISKTDTNNIGIIPSAINTMADLKVPKQKSKEDGALDGAKQGAALGATFGPWGAAIGAVGGAAVGFLTSGKDDGKAEMNAGIKTNRQFNDTYEMGGKLNKYKKGGFPFENLLGIFNKEKDISLDGSSDAYHTGDNNIDYKTPGINGNTEPNNYYKENQPFFSTNKTNQGPLNDSNSNEDATDPEDTFKPKGKDLLQYAPVLGSALNWMEDKKAKPDQEVLNRLGNKYTYNRVDENQLRTIADQSLNNSVNSLSESGASQGQLRSNISASTLGRTQAISDAFMKAEDTNAQREDKRQGFQLGVDQFNIGQDNNQRQINAENKAVTEDRLRASQNALFANIGAVGRENTYDNRLYNMTGGYNNMGKYDPENLSFLDSLMKGKDKTNTGKFGGFMSKIAGVLEKENQYNKMLKNI